MTRWGATPETRKGWFEMANMSYCRFQNTLLDLMDCHEYLWDDDMDEDEQRARKRLIAVCQAIANETESNDDDD